MVADPRTPALDEVRVNGPAISRRSRSPASRDRTDLRRRGRAGVPRARDAHHRTSGTDPLVDAANAVRPRTLGVSRHRLPDCGRRRRRRGPSSARRAGESSHAPAAARPKPTARTVVAAERAAAPHRAPAARCHRRRRPRPRQRALVRRARRRRRLVHRVRRSAPPNERDHFTEQPAPRRRRVCDKGGRAHRATRTRWRSRRSATACSPRRVRRRHERDRQRRRVARRRARPRATCSRPRRRRRTRPAARVEHWTDAMRARPPPRRRPRRTAAAASVATARIRRRAPSSRPWSTVRCSSPAWIGDSRCYWFGDDGAATQLSVDDSWASGEIAHGHRRARWPRPTRGPHSITRWLGRRQPGRRPASASLAPTGAGLGARLQRRPLELLLGRGRPRALWSSTVADVGARSARASRRRCRLGERAGRPRQHHRRARPRRPSHRRPNRRARST